MLDRTLLEQVVWGMPEGVVDEIIVAGGYRVDQITSHFSAKEQGIDVTIVEETEPLGTGGALGNCRDVVSGCLLYTSPSPRDRSLSRMPSSA